MAFCTNCGTKIEDGAKFCPNCGTPVEETPQTPKVSPAPKPAPQTAASASALEKVLPVFKRNYKVIVIAALAVVVLLLLLSRCSGGGKESSAGGKKEQFLDQIQGYWTMNTQVYSDATNNIHRPWNIGVTKNIINLGEQKIGPIDCPISEAEYKDGALYFSAQWYQSIPINGQEPGQQNFDLRLTYDKSSDLLTLEAKVSSGWGSLGEYARTD